MAPKRESGKLVAENRKARFNYDIEDKLEAGIAMHVLNNWLAFGLALAFPLGVALAIREALDPLWLEAGTLDGGAGVAVGIGGIAAEVDDARRRVETLARQHGVEMVWHDDGAAVRATLGAFAVRSAAAMLRVSGSTSAASTLLS